MGKWSAWGAIALGLPLTAFWLLQVLGWKLGWQAAPVGLSAVLLLVGGYRTLRGMKGGLRLLGGAWGLAAGLIWKAQCGPALAGLPPQGHSIDLGASMMSALAALPYVCLLGLALTVLHKE